MMHQLTHHGYNQQRVIAQLREGIEGVLQRTPGVGAEHAGLDVVEGDQQHG